MDSPDLMALERVARNLPVKNVEFGRIEGGYGTIYLAWGLDGDDCYHGVWGCRRVARGLEFKKGTSAKEVRRMLELDANEFVESMERNGCLRENFWGR